MKKILWLVVLVALLVGCRTRYMHFNVPMPPVKPLPEDIEVLVLLDRTATTDTTGAFIEGILTGEGFDQDDRNKQQCLLGIADELEQSGRFDVKRAREVRQGSETGQRMPEPLPAAVVDSFCRRYDADALLVMAQYDSDFLLTKGMRPTNGFSFYAEGVATINIGFRLYDGKSYKVWDEHELNHKMRWNAGGHSIQDAIAALLDKNEAIRQISYEGGLLYASRFSPSSLRITREYFNRGDREVKYGARLMEVNDWDKAIQVFTQIVESSDYSRRNKGFAAHNLAVIYEVLGDIAEAKEWARVAWSEFRLRQSRDYLYQLNQIAD